MDRRIFLLGAFLMIYSPATLLNAEVRHARSEDEAMHFFVKSLLKADPDLFLSIVSRRQTFMVYYDMTGGTGNPNLETEFNFATVSADFQSRTGLYVDLMGKTLTGLDCLADVVVASDGRDWVKSEDNRFVPPDAGAGSRTYVRFQMEDGAWYIAAIGYPVA